HRAPVPGGGDPGDRGRGPARGAARHPGGPRGTAGGPRGVTKGPRGAAGGAAPAGDVRRARGTRRDRGDRMIGVAPPAHDPAAPTTAGTLPVGAPATVRAYVGELLRRHRRAFLLLITVNAIAVIASMVGPYLLGTLVERVSSGARELHLELTAGFFLLALLVHALFVQQVRLRGAMLGERMLADLREDFLVRSVGLPP